MRWYALFLCATFCLPSGGADTRQPSAEQQHQQPAQQQTGPQKPLNTDDIVRKSVLATDRSWKAAPNWAFTERDIDVKGNEKRTKTWEVIMLYGSPYNKLTAVDNKPLSSEERTKEEQKFHHEIESRKSESPSERSKRIEKYQQERNQDHALMREMADAFNYKLVGEESIRNRPAYVLEATPKPGYEPKTRDARVLTGMKGKMYVDKATFQWAKVEAEVIKPVSFYGFLAKVEPGTRFVLEQAPVKGSLWMPVHFLQIVEAKALGIIDKDSNHEESYSNYRPNPAM